MPDDDLLDGCDLDFTVDPTPDDEADLFVLFAEALDPNNPKTVEEAKAEWDEVFG
jgi:hypothetical protein